MKQFSITLAAVLIGAFLALLGYDRFIVQPRAAATVPPQGAPPAPVDVARARAEARQVAKEVEASVQRSVDGAREAMAAQASDMDRRALIASAVSRATMFRVSVTEYYQTHGAWPRSAEDAGLPPSEDMRGSGVSGIGLGERGAVVVDLDASLAAAGSRIVLRPTASQATGLVDWRCEFEGDASLKAILPRCAPAP